MRYPRYIAAALLVIASASPAAANWQFTKWGMTPQEVISAGHLTSIINHCDSASSDCTISAYYSAADMGFTDTFSFKNGKLSSVNLLLLKDADGAKLIELLSAKYGKPIDAYADDAKKTFIWHSASELVTASWFYKVGREYTVVYDPLNAGGL